MAKQPSITKLKPALAILNADGMRVGQERFDLLEAIDRLGSISAAAKSLGLSYRAAWDAVNALNNLFPHPLVIKQPGGEHGGGTLVTQEGRQALAVHRQLTKSLTSALQEFQTLLASSPRTVAFPTPHFWSLIMKTSARNVFHGVVSNIKNGPINTEIALKISDDTEIIVIITSESLDNLGVQLGGEAFALIKATTPILVSADEGQRTSARNRICGAVLSVEAGPVNADVVLDIGAGKTLSATITSNSLKKLDLKPGMSACALIKASQIILGVS